MSVSEPGKIITPWAESGLKNPIPPAANPATGRAGFDQGFSAINMTAKEAGGIPPFGQDFNGIFYEVTNILRYMQAGGQPTFSSAMSTAIGGYPKGCVVLGTDAVTLWQNQVDNNTNDPNSTPTGWFKVDVNLKNVLASGAGASMIGRGASTVDEDITNLNLIAGEWPSCAKIAKILAAGTSVCLSAYGDSTMWGATVGNLGVQDPNNPPSQLRLALSALYCINTTVNNRAISGSTLRGMISGTDGSGSTFEAKISTGGIDKGAQVVYCNHGINDSAQDLGITQYRADVVTFVSLCRKYGKIPVLVTPNPNPPMPGMITEVQSKRLQNYVSVMRDVAETMSCDIVDQYELFTASFNIYKPTEIVPDGAHLASFAYKQAGFNLAIPLIAVNTIQHAGDCAGLTNSTYWDNLTVNRQLQTQDVRTAKIISGERPPSGDQGINFPVVLGSGQKAVSFLGLQWDAAANCIAYDNGIQIGGFYNQRRFGLQSALDWDSETKFYGRKMAGLHVFGLLFNQRDPGLGTGMTFAGVALPKLELSSFTPAVALATPYPVEYAANGGDAIYLRANLPSDVNVRFDDKSGTQVMTIEILAGVATVKLYKNGVVVQTGTGGSGMVEREYGIEVSLSPTDVSVSLDFVNIAIATPTPLPMIRLSTQLKAFVRRPSHIIT